MVTVTATLVDTDAPRPVQVTVAGLPDGVPFVLEGVAPNGSTWPVPGGVGVVLAGGSVSRVDNRAPFNIPARYRVTAAGVVAESAPVTVPYTGHALMSLDGQILVPFVWTPDGMPADTVMRSVSFDVPGRARPPARHAPGGDGGGSMVIRTTAAGSAALRALVRSGAPVVVRCDGQVADWPAVELLRLTAAGSTLWVASRDQSDRVWSLAYELTDDPEPTAQVALWDWSDFNAFWAGKSWADFNAFFAGSDWATFNSTSWE